MKKQIYIICLTIFCGLLIVGLNGVWFAQPIADLISFVVTAVLLIKEVKSDKIETNDKVESEIISLEV